MQSSLATPLTIVIVSLDGFGALIQPIVIEFLLRKLVPETCFQSTAERSKLQLEVRCRGHGFTGV